MAAHDGRIQQFIDHADIISEGATRTEDGQSVYYGTTSLLVGRHQGALREEAFSDLADVFNRDPHARLRALRVAYREAVSRARGPLGPMKAELTVDLDDRGVMLCVDVVAILIASPRRRRGP